MKKYTSVFKLIARHSFHKILILLGIMAAAEAVLFYLFGLKASDFQQALQKMWLFVILGISMFALYGILGTSMHEKHSKLHYTMHRLRISRGAAGCLQGIYNILVFLLVLLVQALFLLGLRQWFYLTHGNLTEPTSSLLTVEKDYPWVLLLFCVLSLLFVFVWAWEMPVFNRSGKAVFRYPVEFMTLRYLIEVLQGDDVLDIDYLVLCVLASVALLVYCILNIFGKRRDEDG